MGSGLAALAAACFLVRDGQMPGDHIHILEAMDVAGGACDGIFDPTRGYIMRAGREMEDHFECLWDLFRSIPVAGKAGRFGAGRILLAQQARPQLLPVPGHRPAGPDAHTDGKFNLSQKGCMEIVKLFMTPDEELYDKTIEDVFDEEVFSSTFWLYWRTMFAFENWHSALEMKLYSSGSSTTSPGCPDFSALKFTRYNQYESLILPMQKYLEAAGVDFRFGVEVTNVLFEHRDGKKVATAIECRVKGKEQGIPLSGNDLVFVTNGSCTEGTIYGDQDHAPSGDAEVRTSGCWDLWKNIARQDPAFGRPEKFCTSIDKTTWESATITTLDERILPYISAICQRDPRSGAGWSPAASSAARTPSGCSAGPSTARDSSRSRSPSVSASGCTACSPTCPATTSKSPCGTAPARRSPRNGCTTSACRWSRSPSWPRTAQSASRR